MAKAKLQRVTAPIADDIESLITLLQQETGKSRAEIAKGLLRVGAAAFRQHCQQRGRRL
jgi:hypothetical protein